ncbi:Uncharacterised protein [Mycobacteroides abscessus subsp. bolletii]|nr:Uncharacterised protein [Mycobacteroides abscessus subsp. bolletii]SKP83745.1 Uncharacterised protein [Mycobacteroides abscessus subsp. bolletii]SKP98844.1 Uncharacterised protein [Mycobacteroides abscessus subsp. bolletii]SKQ17728.1 Uncharacterised protein [Mycobacteroides abscessus subsp. bolletii]SLE92655.1 Uncharacterised protein [Mycobacteroides abscessus subsp. bolletii]
MDFDVSERADGVFVDEQHVPAVGATLFEDDTLRCRFRGDLGEDRKGLAANLNHRTETYRSTVGVVGKRGALPCQVGAPSRHGFQDVQVG